MARSRLLDYMQNYKFWVVDTSLTSVPVFTPVLGFSKCSAPAMTANMHPIKEGNWHFPRKVIKGADVEPITLERGVQFYDGDFWRWFLAGITGVPAMIAGSVGSAAFPGSVPGSAIPTMRKNLLVIQFLTREITPGLPIPGKAWMLYQCMPVGYKPTSDLDAASSEISIQSLTVSYEWFEEFSIGSVA